MALIDGPDCRLFVEIHGEGTPVSVWTHGVTSSIDFIRPFAAGVRGTRILFDLRGHGRSESPPADAGYDHAAMRRDLEYVCDTYGATLVFGVSMGAGAILNLLADRPDRFERIAVFIPASIDAPNAAAVELFPLEAAEIEGESVDELAARAETSPAYAGLFAKRPHLRAVVRQRILGIDRVGAPRALRGYVDGPPPVRDAELLRKVTAPVLILGHDQDPIHDIAVARRLAGIFQESQLHEWPETLAMLDDPDELARLVARFFNA